LFGRTRGGAPLRAIFSCSWPSAPRVFRSSGSVTARHTSTLGSSRLLVIPRSVMLSGCMKVAGAVSQTFAEQVDRN